MDLRGDQQAASIGEDMTLAPLDLLASIETPWAAAFGGLD